MREIIEQLKDVGKNAHGRDIGAGARALNDKRCARITFGGEGDDIVAAFGCGDRMIARKLADPSTGAAAFEDADVSKDGVALLRTF